MNDLTPLDHMTEAQPQYPALPLNRDPMMVLLQTALIDPTIDMDRFDKIIQMKERHESKEAEKSFNADMANCQGSIPSIVARAKNEQTRSKYATLANIYAVAKPIAADFGFSFSTMPAPCETPDHLGVKWTLRHRDGHVESGVAEIPKDDKGMKGTANKTQTHAFGSSNSYARRYLFCMIFDIAIGSEDDDGNAGGGKPVQLISVEQLVAIKDQAGLLGIDESAICRGERIDSLHNLPSEKFASVMSRLEQTESERAAKTSTASVSADLGGSNA